MCDSIFIGQGVGPYAIAGLAITFPLMNSERGVRNPCGGGRLYNHFCVAGAEKLRMWHRRFWAIPWCSM
jgi:hypothetical protein